MKRIYFPLLSAILLFTASTAFASARSLDAVLQAQTWIAARATAQSTAGRVVVLDVFTVDCVNCRNVVPELRALYRTYHANGLDVVGIHSPETPAEKQRGYVVEKLAAQGIVWPVAVDNDFALWRAYGIDAWPTQLFFDRHGRLRKIIVGDSQDDAVAATVRELLSER